jgi:hypothetical protein
MAARGTLSANSLEHGRSIVSGLRPALLAVSITVLGEDFLDHDVGGANRWRAPMNAV